jgi:hypothetical protein
VRGTFVSLAIYLYLVEISYTTRQEAKVTISSMNFYVETKVSLNVKRPEEILRTCLLSGLDVL